MGISPIFCIAIAKSSVWTGPNGLNMCWLILTDQWVLHSLYSRVSICKISKIKEGHLVDISARQIIRHSCQQSRKNSISDINMKFVQLEDKIGKFKFTLENLSFSYFQLDNSSNSNN